MAYTISDLKTDLSGVIHGTDLNKVENLDGLINRASRRLLSDIDPQETIRIVQIQSPIFDRVYDYPLPSDLKGNRAIDIYPQINRRPSDMFNQVNNEEFGAYKKDGTLNIKFDTAFKTLRLANDGQAAVMINPLDDLTSAGTWASGGDAINLVSDNLQYVQGSASLKFDVDGATGTAFIENSTMQPVDLTPKDNEGVVFGWMYMPSTPNPVVTSVTFRWGSSSGDYFEKAVTVRQDGTAFQHGWNLLKFDWNTATTTGSPDSSAINYLRLEFAYPSGTPIQAFRFDAVTSQLGQIFELEYYSKFLFRDAITGAFQETVTDDSNLVNLDVDSYNILFDMVSEMTNQQIVGQPANFDIGYFSTMYQQDVARYTRKYPSQVLTPTFKYYRFPMKRNRRQRRFIS